MRILFTPMAWPSHFYPTLGLIWACRAAGHEVRVAAQPPVLGAVTAAGVSAVSVGAGYDIMAGVGDLVAARTELARRAKVDQPGTFPPEVLRELLKLRMVPHIATAEDMADDLVAFAESWRPDLVITDPVVYAAPLAGAAVGAPVIRHLWGPDMMRHISLPGSGVDPADDPRARWPTELIDLYARFGAHPGADFAVKTLDTCPASLQVPGVPNRIPIRYIPYNGSEVTPAWALEPAKRPRVCVTWGRSATTLKGDDGFLVPEIIEAVAGLDAEVVVTLRREDCERLAAVPAGVRVVEGVPLDLFLSECDVIIHQAGAGTTLTAACHGVPQLTVPQVADQGLVSARLTASGAGLALSGDDTDVAAIRTAVSSLLFDAGPRAAARRLQREILDQPTPIQVMGQLEELAGTA